MIRFWRLTRIPDCDAAAQDSFIVEIIQSGGMSGLKIDAGLTT